MRRAVVVAAAVAVLLGLAPPVLGQAPEAPPVTAGGYLDSEGKGGGLGAGAGGAGGEPSPSGQGSSEVIPTGTGGSAGSGSSGGSGGSGSGGEPPTRWIRHYPKYGADPGLGVFTPFTCEGGRPYVDTLVDTQTGNVLATTTGCEEPAATGPADPSSEVEPAPLPPRPEEIWSVVPVPTPGFGINPGIRGLTGLDAYLWDAQGDAPVTATATVRGYTTTATAVPTHWEWRMWEEGDTPNVNPHPVVSASVPGTRGAPAATYMYETVGDYTLTMTVTWSGTYTFTTPGGGPPQTVDLGTTTRSSSRDYHVVEIRSARVG